jgi:predicted O-methyltransferase YrrM
MAKFLGWAGANGGANLILNGTIRHYGKDGDHVEIGSLFGASAIAVAKAKQEYNQRGTVYCIDPMRFDTHEAYIRLGGSRSEKLMLKNQYTIFKDNISSYGDRIKLVRELSMPWPLPMEQRFSTAFIDGWHYGDGPLNDVKTLIQIVDNAIVIDDIVGKMYPAVHRAFVYLCSHPEWNLSILGERSVLFTKIKFPFGVLTEKGREQVNSIEEIK